MSAAAYKQTHSQPTKHRKPKYCEALKERNEMYLDELSQDSKRG